MTPAFATDIALQRLIGQAPLLEAQLHDAAVSTAVSRLLLASDFAAATLVQQPELLGAMLAGQDAPDLVLDAADKGSWSRTLRRYRAAQSTRLIWRDVVIGDDVDDILAGSTALAECCLNAALSSIEGDFAERFGTLRDAAGASQRLIVLGLGKLGGGELNFSSDVDLVYAYDSDGMSAESSGGARSLAAEDYFARLGQQLAKLLDERTADGFSHRVDLRLRPFGNAGRVALPVSAMEQYFQCEGRDWERYAWQKARPVAGDIAAGDRLLATLRPFVYRRYLDYGALDGLREMKATIAAEVARKELADDIKRGPGGIREIEFLVQALQLIRGGREPALRERRLQPALERLIEAGHMTPKAGGALRDAYRFLRRLENRLQMLRDAQTHALPANDEDRERVAIGLHADSWDALRDVLDAHRVRVSTEFDALLAPHRRPLATSSLTRYWRELPEGGIADALRAAGFDDADSADASLRDFARSPGLRALSESAKVRLDRVLPALLEAAGTSTQPDAALRRLLPLLQTLLRRASYLALLDEQPAALQRLVDVVSRSALLAERLAAYPLLLDELLDVRVAGAMPTRADLQRACAASLQASDTESALQVLGEARQALSFRIALATLDARQPSQISARQLAWLADAVVDVVVALAIRETVSPHGGFDGVAVVPFAVIGYGSLGGEELGFGSDLDIVFLYDIDNTVESNGSRPLEAARWFARLAQKVVALLGTVTGAGRLFDVDVRLRPDGAKGLLVSTVSSFADYQRERAWTWEHQALVRARCVAGDARLCAEFESVRAATLAQPRDVAGLRADIATMRAKMRGELDRSGRDAAAFDLKQGVGGLVDLEFLLQFLVLRDAYRLPALLQPRDTPGLLTALDATGTLPAHTCAQLLSAHAALLDAGLRCTLDRRARLARETPSIVAARAAISQVCADFGLLPATVRGPAAA